MRVEETRETSFGYSNQKNGKWQKIWGRVNSIFFCFCKERKGL